MLVPAVAGDAEDGLVLVRPGAVDDLDQGQVGRIGAALGGVGGAGGGLEALARPAAVLGVRGGEVAVDLARGWRRSGRCVRSSWRRRAYTPPMARMMTSGTKRPITIASQVGMGRDYSSTSRERRCVPTFRLTRCSALSTVLQSQPSWSPMPV